MAQENAVVLGAGFAGLGTAGMLRKRGLDVTVLERAGQVGASWRGRYESLRLNTPRWFSTLHGYRMPRAYGRWPARDRLVGYLEDYARELDLTVRFDTEARRIERDGDAWTVHSSAEPITTANVVVATGYDHDPFIPDWPGRDGFSGELIHAAAYREPSPYEGKHVLVVSAGNTGSEVAYELVQNGAASVATAMRTPPNIFPRQWLGVPLALTAALNDRAPLPIADRLGRGVQRMIYGDLSKFGLPFSPVGYATNVLERHVAPTIDAGFVDAVKAGEIEVVAAVEAFEGPEVILADGSRRRPDAVIAATGYGRGLEQLVGHLGVLDADGQPTHNGTPANPQTPGLYFIGYRTLLSGQIRLIARHSRRVARAIARSKRR